MANVSSSNGLEKYPKLRFKGFSEPWKTDTLGNLGTFMKGAPLSKADIADEGTPFILYGELYTTYGEVTRSIKRRTDKAVEPQFYSKVGDVIMPTSGETPEDIATASCIMLPDVILAGDLLIYRTQKVDGRLVSFVVKNKVNKQISSVAQGKSVVHVRAEELSKITLSYPSDAEQQKILTMLELIEDKIAKQRELIEHLKKYKRGVSEQLFEQIKSKSAQHVFSSVFVLLQNNTFSRELLTNDKTEMQNIHYGDVLIKYGSCVNIDMDDVPYIKSDAPVDKFASESYLMSGDIVIADTAEDYTVGKATEIINPSSKKILSGLHTIPCRPVMSFAPMFMGYYLNSSSFRSKIMPLIQGTKVSSIGKAQLMKTTVYIPPIDEQKRIADLLYSIDTKINLLSETADKMIQLKSAMLQQLFI